MPIASVVLKRKRPFRREAADLPGKRRAGAEVCILIVPALAFLGSKNCLEKVVGRWEGIVLLGPLCHKE